MRKKISAARFLVKAFFIKILNHLPDRILIAMKENLRLVKRMDYPHRDIFLDISSTMEYDTRLHSCKKEPETIEWIEAFFREGDVFYDVGANVGAYSLVASKFLNGKIRVYAFEPGFPTFVQLCKNVLLNNCEESIIPLQIALSDKTLVGDFNYYDLAPGSSLHAFGEAIDYKGDVFKPVFKQALLSYRIDDLVKQLGIPIPSHIKIDVDGIEFSILKGAEETLLSPSMRSILVEVDEDSEEKSEIIEFLGAKGFELHAKHQYVYNGDTGPCSNVHNYIFRRKNV